MSIADTTVGAVFQNPYTPEPTYYTPKVTKIIPIANGPIVREKTFTFTLEPDANNPDGVEYATHDVDGVTDMDGKKTQITIHVDEESGVTADFGEMKFVRAGTYTFTITEDKPADPEDQEEGITYDDGTWTLTIVIKDTDNELAVDSYDYAYTAGPSNNPYEHASVHADAVYDANGKFVSIADTTVGAVFQNPYTPEPTDFTPKATKVIVVDFGPIVRSKTFNFTLKMTDQVDYAGDPMDEGAWIGSDLFPEDGLHTSITIDKDGVIGTENFDTITFTKAGTYTFEITEDPGDEEGIEYDDTTWVLTVVIRDLDNELVVERYLYTVKAAGGSTEPEPGKDDEPVVNSARFAAPLDEGDAGNTGDNNETGSQTGSDDIYTISDESSEAEIDEAALELIKEVEEAEFGAKFKNIYTPEPTNYTPKVTKIIDIAYGPIVREKTFTFTLTPDEGNPEGVEYAEHKADGITMDGKKTQLTVHVGEESGVTAEFGEMTFVRAGTYKFTITEDEGDEEGIDYDPIVWTLTVVVRDTDNELEIESYEYAGARDGKNVAGDSDEAEFNAETLKVVDGSLEEAETGAEFTNYYTPEPTKYQPMVSKTMTTEYGPTVAEKIFNFTLKLTSEKDAAGNDITGGAIIPDGGDKTTLTILAGETDATATFGEIEFIKAGTYTFQILEVKESEEGITYDETEWTLTVTIRDTDNELVVEKYEYATAAEQGESSEAAFNATTLKVDREVAKTEKGAEFTNPYKPAEVEVTIHGAKVVENNPPTADRFDFELKADDESYPMPETPNAHTHGTQTFEIGPITFTKAGVYTYKVNEVITDNYLYTFDTRVYTVTVTVVDTDGTLVATTDYKIGDVEAERARFINTYLPPEVPITIEGTKVWVDNGNGFMTRPTSITVQVLANGVPLNITPTWGDTSGDTWTYTFANLPAVDADNNPIVYTVQETAVEYYTTTINGYTITNTLVPPDEPEFIQLNGAKTWNDNDNATGKRPVSITVRLLRDGVAIDQRTVTAANNWEYTFANLPKDNGYGHTYVYTIHEDAVAGYYARITGTNITNSILPPPPPPTPPEKTEEEWEELIELFDYDTPLLGILGTGEEHPVYPYVFGGIGAIAIAAFVLLGRKRKERQGAK